MSKYDTRYEKEMGEAMTELLKMVKDSKVPAEYRVNAARTMDGINDSAVRAELIQEAADKIDLVKKNDDKFKDLDGYDEKKPWEK